MYLFKGLSQPLNPLKPLVDHPLPPTLSIQSRSICPSKPFPPANQHEAQLSPLKDLSLVAPKPCSAHRLPNQALSRSTLSGPRSATLLHFVGPGDKPVRDPQNAAFPAYCPAPSTKTLPACQPVASPYEAQLSPLKVFHLWPGPQTAQPSPFKVHNFWVPSCNPHCNLWVTKCSFPSHPAPLKSPHA